MGRKDNDMKCCKNCVHCIPDPIGTKGCTETGLVCAVMAPMIYCCVSEEDYHGEGGLNKQCGSGYKPKAEVAA